MKTAVTAEQKQPMGKREVFAWAIITVLVSVSVGLIAGWFLHANMVADANHVAVAALTSK